MTVPAVATEAACKNCRRFTTYSEKNGKTMELRGTILSLLLKVSAPEFEGSFSLILHFVCMSPRPGRIVGDSEVIQLGIVRISTGKSACRK